MNGPSGLDDVDAPMQNRSLEFDTRTAWNTTYWLPIFAAPGAHTSFLRRGCVAPRYLDAPRRCDGQRVVEVRVTAGVRVRVRRPCGPVDEIRGRHHREVRAAGGRAVRVVRAAVVDDRRVREVAVLPVGAREVDVGRAGRNHGAPAYADAGAAAGTALINAAITASATRSGRERVRKRTGRRVTVRRPGRAAPEAASLVGMTLHRHAVLVNEGRAPARSLLTGRVIVAPEDYGRPRSSRALSRSTLRSSSSSAGRRTFDGLARVGPRRVLMRVVGLERDLVDADDVARARPCASS